MLSFFNEEKSSPSRPDFSFSTERQSPNVEANQCFGQSS
jgi:hypothetical protein